MTPDEEWGSEELWALLVARSTGPAKTLIINLDSAPKSRGVQAWYKLMRDAKGTHVTQVHEVTEHLHSADRKQVPAKDLEVTIEAFNHEVRKYTEVTGKQVDEALKVITLKKFLPDKIRVMLQTADLTDYQDCMNYVAKQARVIKNNKAATEPAAANGPPLDAA